jgi:hypothetical protein
MGCPGGIRVGLCAAVRMLGRKSSAGAAGVLVAPTGFVKGPGAVPLAAGAQAHGERRGVKSSVACEDSAFAVCSYFGMVATKLREASGHRSFAWSRLSEKEVT